MRCTQELKNGLAMQETQVQSLDREDFLEKEMATHSSREKHLASYSLWGRKVGQD